MNVKRGDILMVKLDEKRNGSIQAGFRPCLVIQNNVGNRFSPTTIVIPLSSNSRSNLPIHVPINTTDMQQGYIKYSSLALCEQIRTISKEQIVSKVGTLNDTKIKEIENALVVSLGLPVHLSEEVAI